VTPNNGRSAPVEMIEAVNNAQIASPSRNNRDITQH